MLENGKNNGSIYLSLQDAADRMRVSDHHAASNAFDELQARGFIEKAADAHFAVKAGEKSRARTWRLAWLPGPGRKAPRWDFSEPEPGTKEHRRMERGLKVLKRYRKGASQNRFPVVDSPMLHANSTELAVEPVVESITLFAPNGEKLPFPFVVDSPHHSAATMGSAATAKFGLN